MEITPWLFIPLNFRIVFRGSKTALFTEHLFFLISDDIKENHIRHCPISEREKQYSLGTKLQQLKLIQGIYYVGKLGVVKQNVSVWRNLNHNN